MSTRLPSVDCTACAASKPSEKIPTFLALTEGSFSAERNNHGLLERISPVRRIMLHLIIPPPIVITQLLLPFLTDGHRRIEARLPVGSRLSRKRLLSRGTLLLVFMIIGMSCLRDGWRWLLVLTLAWILLWWLLGFMALLEVFELGLDVGEDAFEGHDLEVESLEKTSFLNVVILLRRSLFLDHLGLKVV